MLGRSFLHRLQAPRPYLCPPCSHRLRILSPATRPRALDAFCAARPLHATARLFADDDASPPESNASSPESHASSGDDVASNALTRSQKQSLRKKRRRLAAGELRKGRQENSNAVRADLAGDVPVAPTVQQEGAASNEAHNGTAEEASPDNQPEQPPHRPATKRAKRKAERAVQKAEAQVAQDSDAKADAEKQAGQEANARVDAGKKVGKKAATKAPGKSSRSVYDPDLANVLKRASEKPSDEVLAEAAKDPTKREKAISLKTALLAAKKERKKIHYDKSISVKDIDFTPINVKQLPIPRLSYGLDRVLFNPGVYHLQDTRTGVYNFDPYLQKIMPVSDFDFDLLGRYITSSQDETLSNLARGLGKRYVGSTSSMTASLAHFHFLLSDWREIHLSMLSRGFTERLHSFTRINRLPAAVFLRWKNGTYAIDADKQYDTANVLSMLGKSMEKLLTLPAEEFERYRRGHPDRISDEERDVPESYHYTTQGDMLMRSQLDAYDNRLPGTGMFDLKTRAVVSIRMDIQEWEENTGYQIKTGTGDFESFEREYYDMMRSTMLKYSLQVRMGRMDGIFVAFHNIERIFGFQYVSLEEMDKALHNPTSGTRHLGDQEFRYSVHLLNEALNMATERFPETSIRFHFETREGTAPFMYIFAEAMPDEEVQKIQDANKARTEAWERKVLGLESINAAPGEADDTHQPLDDVTLPELFEIPAEEPQWSSIAPNFQPEAPVRNILDGSEGLSDDVTEEPSTADEDVEAEAPCGPLLALKLWAINRVNGEVVSRPHDVTDETDWTVEYHFEELSAGDARKRYAECKRRRGVGLSDPELTKESLREEERYLSFYQRKLRELSRSGREWRERKDVEEMGKEKVVLDLEPRTQSAAKADAQAAEQASSDPVTVDQYVSWLYEKRD